MNPKDNKGTLTDAAVSQLDVALNAAKARRAAKGNKPESSTKTGGKAEKAPKAESTPKRPRLTDEEKAAREATKAQERASRKTARDAARAAKRAERDAARSPAHMRKVTKAGERLGTMSQAAQLLFSDATTNLPAAQVAILAMHLQHFNRVQATARALSQAIEAGQTVRIIGGDPRFIGQTGTVAKAQRIRCYVEVAGAKKPIYLFTSDVERVAEESAAASA